MASILLNAARRGNVQVLLRMCQTHELILEDIKNESCETLLHVAAKFGHVHFVKELIKTFKENGEQSYVGRFDKRGLTAIHLACENGRLGVVQELCKHSKDLLFIEGRDGVTPFHCACKGGNVELIQFIFEMNKESILERTTFKETVLHFAVRSYKIEALHCLVRFLQKENRLDLVNKTDLVGNTPLHFTVLERNFEALQYLLQCNKEAVFVLEINAMNEKGETAIDLCRPSLDDHTYGCYRHELEKACFSNREIEHMPDAPSSSNRILNQRRLSPPPKPPLTTLLSNAGGDVETFFDKTKQELGQNKIQVCLLLLVTMGASTAYKAAMSPPGMSPSIGVADNQVCMSPSLNMSPSPTPVVPNGSEDLGFIFFMFFNGVIFYTSIFYAIKLVHHFCLLWDLDLLLLALLVTYNYTVIANSPEGSCRMIAWGYCLFMPGFLVFLSSWSTSLTNPTRSKSEPDAVLDRS